MCGVVVTGHAFLSVLFFIISLGLAQVTALKQFMLLIRTVKLSSSNEIVQKYLELHEAIRKEASAYHVYLTAFFFFLLTNNGEIMFEIYRAITKQPIGQTGFNTSALWNSITKQPIGQTGFNTFALWNSIELFGNTFLFVVVLAVLGKVSSHQQLVLRLYTKYIWIIRDFI